MATTRPSAILRRAFDRAAGGTEVREPAHRSTVAGDLVGHDGLQHIERRLTLLAIDHAWSDQVNDSPFGANPMQDLANRAGFALWGAILLG